MRNKLKLHDIEAFKAMIKPLPPISTQPGEAEASTNNSADLEGNDDPGKVSTLTPHTPKLLKN